MRQQLVKGSELLAEYETSSRQTRDKLSLSLQSELQINIQKTLNRYGATLFFCFLKGNRIKGDGDKVKLFINFQHARLCK